MRRLVHDKWSTKGTIHTDDSGVAILDGFKGEYEITVDGKSIKYTLDAVQAENVITVK